MSGGNCETEKDYAKVMSDDTEKNGQGIEERNKAEVAEELKQFKAAAWGVRHQQSLILFFTLTIALSMRSCMGVALVAMTQDVKPLTVLNVTGNDSFVNRTSMMTSSNSTDHFEMHGFFNVLMLTPPYPVFKWSKKVQDTVISSFFWGYMSLQIPAGQLAHRFGTRYLLTGAMFINCAVMALIPHAAYYGGWICLVFIRILQGASQACIVPGMHTFFGKWAPLEERGRLSSLAYGGLALGPVLGLTITGFISSTSMGWPGLFRFYALLSGAIGVIIWWLAADTPSKHTQISDGEKRYIEEGLGLKPGGEQKLLPVPWSRIFRSMGVYAIIVAHCASSWGQLILYSEVPAYMDNVMGVSIKMVSTIRRAVIWLTLCIGINGVLTALPFVVMWLANFFFSWFTDLLIVKKVMSVTNVRKCANSLGYIPSAIGLVALGYAPKNIYVVETLLIVICFFKVSSYMGFQINHIDISPNFAGTLMSISNFVCNAIGSLSPIVAGVILTDVKSEYLWRQVFLVAAGLFFFSNLFYCIFGSAEVAEWNEPGCDDNDQEANPENKPMLERKSHTL